MKKEEIKKIYLIIIAVFVVVGTSFYFLAGDKLWYKTSESNVELGIADGTTVELNRTTTITQNITTSIDRIENFIFSFSKEFKVGAGTVWIEIFDGNESVYRNGYHVYDAIPDLGEIYIKLDNPILNARGKTIKVVLSSTSPEGEGAKSQFIAADTKSKIIINDSEEITGSLRLAVSGSDRLSFGQYYWYAFAGLLVIISLALFISYKRFLNGKHDYLIVYINALHRYRFLIDQLVERDFKTKYKRSVFGILWSFLNPLLTMIVQFFVFSTIFRVDTQNYPVYLISGVVCFGFFNECTTMCLNSISGNYRLITKVYIPKYIFPFSKTLSSSVNLGISLIPLLLVTLVTGTALRWSFILMFYFLICLIIFSLGVGMILATLMVFFRDIQFIWSVIITIWQYATPIFYPAEIIPEKYQFIVKLNPLYHFIGNVRKCLIDGISPEPISYLYCLIFALGALLIGSLIFKKNQDKFTLYL